MKKLIAITIAISLLAGTILALIPKHEIPTDAEWEEFLRYEEEFFQWRDNIATDECTYQVQNSITNEIYFIGSLQDCKDILTNHPDGMIMPYTN